MPFVLLAVDLVRDHVYVTIIDFVLNKFTTDIFCVSSVIKKGHAPSSVTHVDKKIQKNVLPVAKLKDIHK